MQQPNVKPATGRLGILTPGMGAVSTTFMAGVIAARKGVAKPIGSLTEMGYIRLGKRTEKRNSLIREFLPFARLEDIAFGGWGIYADNAYQAAVNAKVLRPEHLEAVKDELSKVKPMSAVFDNAFVKNISDPNVKKGKNKMDLADQLRADMREFKKANNCDRLVLVWCGSTESYLVPGLPEHASVAAFEQALRDNSPNIAPSMVYTYAAIMEGVPYVNGAPNLSVETPALQKLAEDKGVPIAGSDFKTGQTLMKTIVAPGLKARLLGIAGWYSTNILGNRDGEVLQDPDSFKSKEVSKLSVLESVLEPERYPDLYGDLHHLVKINYYRPRGDNKEGWDNIDIFGWMGYDMQIKINFLCRDSILAAPLVLDLAQFMDLAARSGFKGIQEWLSFYLKSPITKAGLKPEHDLHVQKMKLENTLRYLGKEELINHLGLTYYGYDEGDASKIGN
ncbi:MAG: inositol-3-phosphate synthase [Bdellovibrionota bacterium]